MTTEDKFYMGWAIKIAQTSTFKQAAEHLRQFLREALALREPAPEADELRDCRGLFDLKEGQSLLFAIETMRGDNAELRRKLEELQGWKDSMIAVDSKCDWQEIGRELGLTLGTDVRASILPKIRELKQQPAWVPVSTPPTEKDADDRGKVVWRRSGGCECTANYREIPSGATYWHPLTKLQADEDEAVIQRIINKYMAVEPPLLRKYFGEAVAKAALAHARQQKD
jgi:hypothetical protein